MGRGADISSSLYSIWLGLRVGLTSLPVVYGLVLGLGWRLTSLPFCIVYGSALLSHSLHGGGFSENAKIGSGFDPENGTLVSHMQHTHSFLLMTSLPSPTFTHCL